MFVDDFLSLLLLLERSISSPPFLAVEIDLEVELFTDVVGVTFGDGGACSSIFVSKYFLGGEETVSSLLPLRGGMVGGLADLVLEAGAAELPDTEGDITGLVADCLLVFIVGKLSFFLLLILLLVVGVAGFTFGEGSVKLLLFCDRADF